MKLSRKDLHKYQEHAAEAMAQEDRYYLGLDMGLGKTASSLTAVVDLLDSFDITTTLVVAPLRVAIDTWPSEIKKWEHLAHLKYSVMVGTAAERLAALQTKADVYIINVDNLCWIERMLGIKKFPFDVLILDEGTNYKNRDSKRCKTAMRMSRMASRVYVLSATPAPNGYLDLWSQYYILDQGQRLFPQYTRYQNTYFDIYGQTFRLRRGADKVIQDKLADITLTMRAEDYLEMPDKTIVPEWVTLSDHARRAYDDFEVNLVHELGETEIAAFNAGTVAGKLIQFANGTVYDADKVPHVIHGDKLVALKELVAANHGDPLIIAYHFTSDRDRIRAAIPGAEVIDKDPETIKRWNQGQIPVLLVHPASAGHGLNLQFGGRRIIWYGPTWNLEHWIQLNGRLARQGQARPVFIHVLLAKSTIDTDIMRSMEGKNTTQEALLNALKQRINKIKISIDMQ